MNSGLPPLTDVSQYYTFKNLTNPELSAVSNSSKTNYKLVNSEAKVRLQTLNMDVDKLHKDTHFLPLYNNVCLAKKFLQEYQYTNPQSLKNGRSAFEQALITNQSSKVLNGLLFMNVKPTITTGNLHDKFKYSLHLLHCNLTDRAVLMMANQRNLDHKYEFAVKLLESGHINTAVDTMTSYKNSATNVYNFAVKLLDAGQKDTAVQMMLHHTRSDNVSNFKKKLLENGY